MCGWRGGIDVRILLNGMLSSRKKNFFGGGGRVRGIFLRGRGDLFSVT